MSVAGDGTAGRESFSAVAEIIGRLRDNEYYREAMVHHEYLPPRPAGFARLDPGLPEPLPAALGRLGAARLWSHQVEAIAALRRGEHVLVATPTASGKTLIYNLPVLNPAWPTPRPGRCTFTRSRPWSRTSSASCASWRSRRERTARCGRKSTMATPAPTAARKSWPTCPT